MKNLLIGLVTTLAILISNTATAAKFKINPGDSSVIFKTPHGKFGILVGRFNTFEGTFEVDLDKANHGKANITIIAASVDTNGEDRDKHLRGNDFLSVKEFPKIEFTASSYKGDAKKGELTGNLSLHGVTKPVTLQVERIDYRQVPEKFLDKVSFVSKSGYKAIADLKLSEFGIGNVGGDRVTIEIFVEAIEPKS